MYKCTTFVANKLFDEYLCYLSEAEIKVMLVIIRQTIGWTDKRTGKRKVRDRITHQQFVKKTGLSDRSITRAVQKLIIRKLIEVTDGKKEVLTLGSSRKGKSILLYRSLL